MGSVSHQTLKPELLHDPAVPLLSIYANRMIPEELYSQKLTFESNGIHLWVIKLKEYAYTLWYMYIIQLWKGRKCYNADGFSGVCVK